jgi:hypothetical protein
MIQNTSVTRITRIVNTGRIFARLILLATILLSLPGSAFSNAVEDDWLEELIDRLDPKSEPAKILAVTGPSASDEERIAVVAEYFRKKPLIRPLWVIEMPDRKNPNHDTRLADGAVDNFITSMYGQEQFGEKLPWFSADKKVRTLARFPHFDYLAPAYFHTGNEDYPRTMIRHMEDFIDNVPIERAANVNVQTNYIINPWNWVLQHWRILRWIDALAFLRDSSSLSDSTYLRILLHLWKEVDWLVPRMILGLHNGTLGNIRGVLYAGLNFPEAANGLYWQKEAASVFRSFMSFYFYPGEVSVELTLGYSSAVLAQCLKIYDALPAGNLKESIGPALEKLVDGHVGLMKPDRSLPRYGDHGNYDMRVDILGKAARIFDRPDLLWLADEGPNQIVPHYLSFPGQSRPYYLSGYYAMRDGWGRAAQYLCMDAGPYGTNHQHADKLSITLAADGANFIVDPGTSIYNSTELGPRYDLRFGYLHNAVTINGIDQNAGWDQHYQFDVLDSRWVTNEAYDFLEGSYDYRSNGLDIIHRRTIFYKRGEYWLLFDALKGEGSFEIESNFQFMFDNDVETAPEGVISRAPNGAVLHMVSASDGLEPNIIVGDTSLAKTQYPVRYPNIDHIPGGRGWVGTFGNYTPHNPNRTYPAPAVVFSGRVALPHYSVRLLSPSKDRHPRLVRVTWIDRAVDHVRIRIEHTVNGQPIVDIFDWNPGPRFKGRKKPEHENGFWLRQINRRLSEIIFFNTTMAKYEDRESQVELGFSAKAEGYLVRDGNDWRLYMDGYVDSVIDLLVFKYSQTGITPKIYVKDGKSNLALRGVNRKDVSELTPGNVYRLVPR